MEQYRIETHLHTNHTSKCGWLDAAALAEGYAQAGYAAVAVTDHYNRDTFEYLDLDTTSPGDVMSHFLDGFRRMEAECARRGLKVYKGAELRFDECCNDYLLYNCPDELLARPEEVFRMGIAAFAPLAREAGALLVQAHPYRKKCTPAFACYLDGVEVCNLNPRPPAHRRLRLPPVGGHRPGRHPGPDPAGGRRGSGPAAPRGGIYRHRRGMILRPAA